MNWIFGKNQNQQVLPPPTPLQQHRIKQIKSLHNNNSNVVEVNRDFEYRVLFSSGKTLCTLHVNLPPQFPSEKPVVYVSPPLKHPWVDENMQVLGCKEINLFQMHTDLGKAIQTIVKEFKKNKPTILQSNYPVSSIAVGNLINTSEDVTSLTSSVSTTMYPGSCDQGPPPRQTTQSEIENIVKQLEDLGRNKLEEICINPDLLLDYVHNMESVIELQNQRIELVEQNEIIAKENLAAEPIIEDLKVELKGTFEHYNDVYHSVEEKLRKQDEYHKNYDTNNIMNNLRIAILQAEEESEAIAEDFLKGSANLDKFLTTFLDKRKTCHLRRMKEERLKGLIVYQ